jgi:hypothetical protein
MAARRAFPIGLAARQGKSVVIMMNLWTPVDGASPVADAGFDRTLRELTATLASLTSDAPSDRLQLRLDHVPGGSHVYPVSAVSLPTSSAAAVESAGALEGALLRRVSPQLWKVDLLTHGKRLAGIILRRLFAGADELDLARLDLWKVRSQFHRTLRRPVLARKLTLFPLPDLVHGAYIATVEVRGQVVAYKSFAVR